MDCILLSLSTSFAVDWLLKNLFIERLIKNSFKAKGLPFILFQTCIKGNLLFRNYMQNFNPLSVVLDQLIIPSLIFFFILITCLLEIVFTLYGETTSWSLVGVKGLKPKLNWLERSLLSLTNQQLLGYCDGSDVHYVLSIFFYVFSVLQNKKAVVGNEVNEKPPYRNQASNMFIVQMDNFSLELVLNNQTIDIFQFKFTTINLLFYTLKLNFN